MFVEVEGVSPELGRSPASHVVNSRVMMDLAMLVSNACDLPTDVSPAVSLGVTPEELVREAEELQLRGQHRIVQGSVWDPLDQLQSNQRQQLPTVSATEQPESTTLPPEKQMIYAIVNAFFNNITFQYPDAEELLTSGKDARGQQPERREAESVRSGGGIVSKSPSRNGYSQTDGMDTPTDASTSAGSPTPWQFENNSLPKITVPS